MSTNPVKGCLNCEEIRTDAGVEKLVCYECYILSGQEDRDREVYLSDHPKIVRMQGGERYDGKGRRVVGAWEESCREDRV